MPEPLNKILYVDDENINLRSFRSLFRRKYQIFTALSGNEALEILEQEPIDILVTDQIMPNMTGLELLKIVSDKYPSIMLMILTGYSEMAVIKEAINECGVYSYLNKPWEKELLERTFDRALEHQKLIRERETMIAMLHKSNEELEKKVVQRTEQVNLQNEELTKHRDELVSKNKLLQEAQETIHKTNDQLKRYNQDLERQVQNRTKQLSESNLKLSKYNEQLEQFAFLAAHNFRGPVASLLGLIQLVEMQPDATAQELLTFIGNIKSVAIKLDDVITDLNQILHQNTKDKSPTLELVSFENIMERVENALNAQIIEAQAMIEKDFTQLPEINSESEAIEQILYQLLSNSLAFRGKNKECIIKISTTQHGDHRFIIIEDNGIGIDLELYGEKVFGVYQTFHLGKGGKGLGLFSVRNTVHRLGGHIHVESKPNQGTKFTIELPTNLIQELPQITDSI